MNNYLIYGTGSGWGPSNDIAQTNLFIVDWSGGNSYQLLLPHGVNRIEAMGADAVVVGTDGKNLHFSSVRLGQAPELVSRARGSIAGRAVQSRFLLLAGW